MSLFTKRWQIPKVQSAGTGTDKATHFKFVSSIEDIDLVKYIDLARDMNSTVQMRGFYGYCYNDLHTKERAFLV